MLALALVLLQQPDFNADERAFQSKWAGKGGELVWVKEERWMLSLDLTLGPVKLDFRELSPLKRLAALRVFKGTIREETLGTLAGLPKLELLVILSKGLTDRGLAAICRMPHLNKLDVAGPTISSTGLAHLARLPELRRLFLYNTALTDRDLAPLERLTRLQDLTLPKTVSAEGLARLKAKLPTTRIDRM